MKVKLKISYLNHPPGAIVDLDSGIANTLLFVNRAEAIAETKPLKQDAKCTTKQPLRQR
jgi:hypothetical protein